MWCGFALAEERDLENQLKETTCFPAPHWEDAALFEVVYQLLIISLSLHIRHLVTFLRFLILEFVLIH